MKGLNVALADGKRIQSASGSAFTWERWSLADIGYERHAQFTVIGDPVNVAARLQDLTKPLSCEVLMSEDV